MLIFSEWLILIHAFDNNIFLLFIDFDAYFCFQLHETATRNAVIIDNGIDFISDDKQLFDYENGVRSEVMKQKASKYR